MGRSGVSDGGRWDTQWSVVVVPKPLLGWVIHEGLLLN